MDYEGWGRQCFHDDSNDLKKENKRLENEIEYLTIRLNSLLTKDVTVLKAVKSVKCPLYKVLVSVDICEQCVYVKQKLLIRTCDNSHEYIYCAYKEQIINGVDFASGDDVVVKMKVERERE